MKTFISLGTAALLSMSSVVMAQTATGSSAPEPKVNTAAPANASDIAASNGVNDRQKLMTNLQKAGFTNVKVTPDSFIVEAKDKSGDPVTMFLDADSMVVFTNADSDGVSRNVPPDAIHKTAVSAGGQFASIQAKDDLSSQLIGLDVYNNAKQDIGKIKDIAFSRNGVKAYIVGVGGFLGMDERYVAVQTSALNLSYDTTDKKWHAAMDTTADQLKAAPEYKYPSKS